MKKRLNMLQFKEKRYNLKSVCPISLDTDPSKENSYDLAVIDRTVRLYGTK